MAYYAVAGDPLSCVDPHSSPTPGSVRIQYGTDISFDINLATNTDNYYKQIIRNLYAYVVVTAVVPLKYLPPHTVVLGRHFSGCS